MNLYIVIDYLLSFVRNYIPVKKNLAIRLRRK